MFKKIRKAINDGALYALGVSSSQLSKEIDNLLEKSPENHVLHGCLFPLISRYHEIEKDGERFSSLKSSIDSLLLKAGCISEQQFDVLNFTIAAYSIELCRNTLAKTGFFEKETFEAFVAREWKASYSFYKTSSHKNKLSHLIGNAKEKVKFTRLAGKLESPDLCDQLYFQKSQVISFILTERASFFNHLGNSVYPEEIVMWRWIFGDERDGLFLNVRAEFVRLFNEVNASTNALYSKDFPNVNTDKDKAFQENKDSITMACPSCSKLLRLKLPIKSSYGKCGACQSRFVIKGDNQGKIWLESAPIDNKSEVNKDITEALTLLGLNGKPTREQIKSAYRKKISEYHPDKVNGLGDKLKALAEEESKRINLAIEVLKKSGYL